MVLRLEQIASFIPEVGEGVQEILGREVDFSEVKMRHFCQLMPELADEDAKTRISFEYDLKHTQMASAPPVNRIYVFPIGYLMGPASAKVVLAHELTHIADEQLYQAIQIKLVLKEYNKNAIPLLEKVSEAHAEYVLQEWKKRFGNGEPFKQPSNGFKRTKKELDQRDAKYTDGLPLIRALYEHQIPIKIAYEMLPMAEELKDPEQYLERIQRRK